MAVKTSQSVSITSLTSFTLDDIAKFVESAKRAGATGDETVSVRSYAGDRPWDSGQSSLTVNINGGKN